MEPIKSESSNSIPKALVYLTMSFVLISFIDFGFRIHTTSTKKPQKQMVGWIDLTDKLTEKYRVSKQDNQNLNESTDSEFLCKSCKKKVSSKKTNQFDYEIEDNISELLGFPKNLNKPIIYEFYSKNSDPCIAMEKNSFRNKQVIDLLTKNFTPVRVSYNKDNARELMKSLSTFRQKYRVCAYPTLVVVDAKGEEVTNLVGNCSSLTTYKFLSRTKAKLKTMGYYNNKKIASLTN